jgi:UDP-2-acetamido-2,6-beta-L-arabino-hexul-4-ose reductase
MSFPTDARGLVLEPLDGREIAAMRNGHLVVTNPGGVRGNHHHVLGTEVSVVLGPALVRVRDESGLRDYAIAAGEAYRFRFPPGVGHAILATGPTASVGFAYNTQPHDPTNPDLVREVLIEPGEAIGS